MICVDASLVLTWLFEEELSAIADSLRTRWLQDGEVLVAPGFLRFEVTSVLRSAVQFGRMQPREGDVAFDAFARMPIELRQPQALMQKAWELGKRLDAPKLYDIYYLALAEIEECEVWTADQRFVRFVSGRSPFLRWLGDA